MPDDTAVSAEVSALLGVEASLSGKKWRARPADERAIAEITRQCRLPEALARVLAARGLEAQEVAGFLAPRLRDTFPDPSRFQDLDKAAGLIWDAVDAGRQIAIFADYDVDGATSAAQLCAWLRDVGQEPLLYVPDRIEEGYGPTRMAFERLKARGAELVITVDCGAAARQPIEDAVELGLDVIVIDHHLMDETFPPALALVNPNRPDDTSGCGHLAAAGVTFVCLAALNREGRRRGRFDESRAEPDIMALSDLAALGTVCDVVSLTGFNRALVAQGLKIMSGWRRPGLKALAETAGIEGEASAYHAGYLLGPRINAGGRIGQPDLGVQLLTALDLDTAMPKAQALDRYNTERRDIEADVLDQALAQVSQSDVETPILIAAGDDWHAGVIGIVAGRLKERFGRPSLVIGIDRQREPVVGKGSGRSVPGVNLGGAIARAREAGLLEAGGGHAMAGGLTVKVEQIQALYAFLEDTLSDEWAAAKPLQGLNADAVISAGGATLELIDLLEQAAPFGQGNPQPRFVVADVRIQFAKRVGADHVRFTLEDSGGARLGGIAFRCADEPLGEALLAVDGTRFHALGKLQRDTWNGRNQVQFQLEDMSHVVE